MKKREESLQIAVCRYIAYQYPKVIFLSDASGIRLSIGLATKWKKMHSERGIPDLIILEPCGELHALCLELKKDKDSLFQKNGALRNDKHIQEQNAVLSELGKKGYYAVFACGFDHAKNIIDRYMTNKWIAK